MSETDAPQFFIAWKGANTGPFTLAQIQEKLAAGEVSRMHQVQAGGRWISVDELLAKRENTERQTAQAKEVHLRRDYEARLAAEHAHQQSLAEQLEAAERRARLLPPPPPPQPAVAGTADSMPAFPVFQPAPHYPPMVPAAETSRTSGFAIAAFIFALCNFIPFLNFVSWVLALVFGHVAMRDINHNPTLAGRGLAISALCITYFLLILGFTIGVLAVMDGRLRF